MVDTLWPANAVSGAPEFNARMRRQANSAVLPMGDPARPLGGLSGVRSGTPTTTVTATSTTWTCKPFAGSADVMTASESGPYEFAFDANATGSVNAADASNPRVDIVYVQITDPEDGATVPVATRGYLAGSAAVSPAPPATPARSFVIAQINVPKAGGGSPTVTWVATGVTPGNIQFQTKTLLDAWATAPDGMRASVIGGSEYLSSNGAWSVLSGTLGIDVLSSTQLLTTSETTISGLSVTVVTPNAPVRVRATIQLNNAGSGADRTASLRIFEDGVAVSTARVFSVPIVSSGSIATAVVTVRRTPSAGSHTYTVRGSASINTAVTIFDCDIDVSVIP